MTTRQKLIEKVSEAMTDIPQLDVVKAVEMTFDYMAERIVFGDRVEVRGFGSFSLGSRIITPSTNLMSVMYHHKKVKTINYKMALGLQERVNMQHKGECNETN